MQTQKELLILLNTQQQQHHGALGAPVWRQYQFLFEI